MHIKIAKTILAKSLSRIHSVVEKRGSIPVLSNVKVETTDDAVILSVTDMDLYATDSVTAEIIEPGSLTLPVHMLFDIIKKLPDETVISLFHVKNSANGALLKAASVECILPTLPAEEFPQFTNEQYEHNFNLESKDLKRLLSKTKYAISTEDTRYYLNGIYLHLEHNDKNEFFLRTVATDSHRLAVAEIRGVDGMPGIIIPRKTVNEIIKLLEDSDGTLSIAVSLNRILLKIGSVTLISKLVDGKFPDYKKAIPVQCNKILEVAVAELADAIDLVTTISSDKTKSVKFFIEKNAVRLCVNNNMNGASQASQQINAKYDATPIEIAFNGRYMLDVLAVFDGPNAIISIIDSNHAVLLRDSTDDTAMHVIMPMQV